MKKIAENVYQISVFPRNAINCYLVDDVLVDAGIRSSASKILKLLKNFKVSKHVLTHVHPDHQGSSKEICETLNIPFFVPEKEKEMAENPVFENYANGFMKWMLDFEINTWAGEGYKVSGTLKEGDTVGSFRVLETPGHSPGHISLYRESDSVLIASDALVNMNLFTTVPGLNLSPKAFTYNMDLAKNSLLKLHQFNPKIICFGHGPVLRNDGHLEKLIQKLKI